jgi:hypothetical protein
MRCQNDHICVATKLNVTEYYWKNVIYFQDTYQKGINGVLEYSDPKDNQKTHNDTMSCKNKLHYFNKYLLSKKKFQNPHHDTTSKDNQKTHNDTMPCKNKLHYFNKYLVSKKVNQNTHHDTVSSGNNLHFF